MFQQPRLLHWQTTADTIALGLRAHGMARPAARERAHAMGAMLGLDAEAVTGGQVATLTRDWKGLPASVLLSNPELAGYVALRIDSQTASRIRSIMNGQVAVAMYDDQERYVRGLIDFIHDVDTGRFGG